jgi:hypothetical protein
MQMVQLFFRTSLDFVIRFPDNEEDGESGFPSIKGIKEGREHL